MACPDRSGSRPRARPPGARRRCRSRSRHRWASRPLGAAGRRPAEADARCRGAGCRARVRLVGRRCSCRTAPSRPGRRGRPPGASRLARPGRAPRRWRLPRDRARRSPAAPTRRRPHGGPSGTRPRPPSGRAPRRLCGSSSSRSSISSGRPAPPKTSPRVLIAIEPMLSPGQCRRAGHTARPSGLVAARATSWDR